jgi:hypothetical protein
MSHDRVYPGIHHDEYGGMTDVGRIIRDAWVFGILPETEGCENWSYDRINIIYDQVARAWEPYGHLASKLPPELRARHERIFAAAIARARELGWNVELGEDD